VLDINVKASRLREKPWQCSDTITAAICRKTSLHPLNQNHPFLDKSMGAQQSRSDSRSSQLERLKQSLNLRASTSSLSRRLRPHSIQNDSGSGSRRENLENGAGKSVEENVVAAPTVELDGTPSVSFMWLYTYTCLCAVIKRPNIFHVSSKHHLNVSWGVCH